MPEEVLFRPKVSRRGEYYFAELATSPGPQEIAVTGDGSFEPLYGREWILELSRDDNKLKLYQEAGSGLWQRITEPLPIALFADPLPEDARRITFTFDQSARLAVAYEINEHIFMTRWDPSEGAYVSNVDFPGVDPALLMDATLLLHVPGSDIVLFYLSVDRQTVRYRRQGENYSSGHDLITADEPLILDRAGRLPSRYQLLVSDADGEPIEDAGLVQVLRSELYPVRVRDTAAIGGTGLRDGAIDNVVVNYEHAQPIDIGGTGLRGGSLGAPIVWAETTLDTVEVGGTGLRGGSIEEPVVWAETTPDTAEVGATGLRGGEIDQVVIYHEPETESVAVGGTGLRGGSINGA